MNWNTPNPWITKLNRHTSYQAEQRTVQPTSATVFSISTQITPQKSTALPPRLSDNTLNWIISILMHIWCIFGWQKCWMIKSITELLDVWGAFFLMSEKSLFLIHSSHNSYSNNWKKHNGLFPNCHLQPAISDKTFIFTSAVSPSVVWLPWQFNHKNWPTEGLRL